MAPPDCLAPSSANLSFLLDARLLARVLALLLIARWQRVHASESAASCAALLCDIGEESSGPAAIYATPKCDVLELKSPQTLSLLKVQFRSGSKPLSANSAFALV